MIARQAATLVGGPAEFYPRAFRRSASPFDFGGKAFVPFVEQTSGREQKAQCENGKLFSPLPARGERSSDPRLDPGGTRVRGPIRDSERSGLCGGVAGNPARLSPAERPPHPDLLLRLRAPRFGGLKPAVARRASEGGPRAGRRSRTRRASAVGTRRGGG